MAFEHNDNSGSLFRNDRRENDRQPTHTGSGKIDGVEYWISAWVNEIKSGPNAGGRFFGLKFSKKDGQSGNSRPATQPDLEDPNDDDIPF